MVVEPSSQPGSQPGSPPGGGPSEAPARGGVQRCIRKRLSSVQKRLRETLCAAPGDPEPVHTLRIACRRAEAALDAFAPCLPPARARRARKAMRAVRRAASDARRADVHLRLFRTRASSCEGERHVAAAFVLGSVEAERERAYESMREGSLERAARRVRPRRLARAVSDPQAGAPATLGGFTRGACGAALAGVRAASGEDLGDPERLHDFRIAGKSLRYSLDLFEPCLDDEGFRALAARLAELQSHLGDANDLREMADRCERLAQAGALPEPLAGALGALRDDIAARRDAAHSVLLAHWSAQSSGLLAEVERMIEAPSPAPAGDPEPVLRIARAPAGGEEGETSGGEESPIARIEAAPTGSNR